MLVPLLLCSTVLCGAPLDTARPALSVLPATVYIERTVAGQEVNFDFLLDNATADSVVVTEIEVSVFDPRGRLVLRRFLDENGSSPSMEIVSRRSVGPAQKILIFNPFHTFPGDTQLAELRFRFRVARADTALDLFVTVTPRSFQPKTQLVLPLAGRFIVYDGHDFYSHHRRLNFMDDIGTQLGISANFMRYAYDFIPVDSTGVSHEGDPARNQSWLGFGAQVLAPGAGRVVQITDRSADDRTIDMAAVMQDPVALYGNYIVIDHLNGEFSMLGHIRQGSARVRLGDRVKQGQHIADVGAAGSSHMPHLHYELRTGTGVRGVEGLPSYFSDYAGGTPATGQFVLNGR